MNLPDNFQIREHSWTCRFHIIPDKQIFIVNMNLNRQIILSHFFFSFFIRMLAVTVVGKFPLQKKFKNVGFIVNGKL
jgi:hypothetical protein